MMTAGFQATPDALPKGREQAKTDRFIKPIHGHNSDCALWRFDVCKYLKSTQT
jgi:hypothetical protein